jgi:hypothetical protein
MFLKSYESVKIGCIVPTIPRCILNPINYGSFLEELDRGSHIVFSARPCKNGKNHMKSLIGTIPI